MDRAKGRIKEAGGALTGQEGKKREGRSDQRKGKAKEKKGDLKDLLS
ncbi:MAG TPA: CsbD family protein [Rubrobacter sp.]|nr:CsbD family protein [Rubrobacter sp.]